MAVHQSWFDPKNEPVEKPYPDLLEPGVVARVRMARSAGHWLPDIEAYLVEQELSTDIAPAIAKLMDHTGWSLPTTVTQVRSIMLPEHGGTYVEGGE